MSGYEYKTVALPNAIEGKLRRRQTEADLIAETLGETLRTEAVDGWEYMRAETLISRARASIFSRSPVDTPFTVLIFRRVVDAVWRGTSKPEAQQDEAEVQESLISLPQREARPTAKMHPKEPAPPAPEPDLRPPLGSAQD